MPKHQKINIAIAGGPCTGKSTLAAYLFASQKIKNYDYDLVTSEHRKLHNKLGKYNNPFKYFYLWRLQEQAELGSTGLDGFITDTPLFNRLASAEIYSTRERDKLAVSELFRMCLELEDRYQIIVIAKDPFEIYYHKENRPMSKANALRHHHLTRNFVEQHWPYKLVFVSGTLEERLKQIEDKLNELRNPSFLKKSKKNLVPNKSIIFEHYIS